MLSQHSSRRDHNGIPITRPVRRIAFCGASLAECIEKENWNRNNWKLRDLATKTIDVLAQIAFMERWFLPHLRPLRDPKAHALADRIIDHTTDRSVTDELETLTKMLDSAQQRWQDMYDIMSAGMVYAMRWVNDRFPAAIPEETFRRPLTLIRMWTQKSHSPYSDDLGFRCSDWVSCKPHPNIRELLNDRVLTEGSLRNHCEKKSRASVWISFSDDVSWTLYYAQRWRLLQDPSCQVAIVSVQRLERCNIPWGRSHDLVELAGGQTYNARYPDGIQHACFKHILVYGCVPAQCLVAKLTIQRFCELCAEHNIEGKKGDVSPKPPHILLQPPSAVDEKVIDSLSTAVDDIQL